MQNSVGYRVGFAAVICIFCSLLVSSTAVVLKPRQDANKLLDKQQKVLAVSGLIAEGSTPTAEEVNKLFEERIDIQVLNMETGAVDENSGIDNPLTYNQLKASKDSSMSFAIDSNRARVSRVPNHVTIYTIKDEDGAPSLYVLPVEGMGLWGTMYGFVAIDKDLNTIQGLTFYKHKETPGLGAEIEPGSLPSSPGFLRSCARLGLDAMTLQAAGGEDYELLFGLSRESSWAEPRRLSERLGVSVSQIGRVVQEPGIRGLPKISKGHHF